MTDQANAQTQNDQEAKFASVAHAVQASVDSFRVPLGELVTKAGNEGQHPIGVALALSLASATVIASMGAAAGMPRNVMQAMVESMAVEATESALATYDVIAKAKSMGKTDEEIAAEFQKHLS